MANCVSCAAPLPEASVLCGYCGTRNAVDLLSVHRYSVVDPRSPRICPRCDVHLRTINLEKIHAAGESLNLRIEQCPECTGTFFDPGELEHILEKGVENVYVPDRELIESLVQSAPRNAIRYLKCPVCRELMQFRNYLRFSGVLVDFCSSHGLWLDAGELRQLLEWTKAGGKLLADRRGQQARQMEAERQARAARRAAQPAPFQPRGYSDLRNEGGDFVSDALAGIVRSLFR